MARTAYLAPGVYVEEVPSAQQPIAGVGTNTVGFIGIVPDVIYYPEDNPDYDPVVAQATVVLSQKQATEEQKAQAKATVEADITRMNAEIKKLDEETIPAAEKRVNDAAAAGNEAARTRAQAALDNLRKRRQAADDERKNLQDKLAGSQPAASQEITESDLLKSSVLKPYLLKRFDVEADPFDTKLCTNFTEYTNRFGSFPAYFPEPVPNNKEVQALAKSTHRQLTHAVYGFFKNGGTRCFVARIRDKSQLGTALKAFESIDAIAIIAAPGFDGQESWTALTDHCEACEDRFAILDCPEKVEDKDGGLDTEQLQYSQGPSETLPQRNKNAAFYFPYIEVVDPAKQLQDEDPAQIPPVDPKYWGRLYVPPSGHIAGIYARTDEERGVHKAPANAAVRGALNVKYYVGKAMQELLNPQGVNCIRNMNGNINVWGARTIGGDKNAEWKYINVRRFFLFLRESIDEGTQWVVFEPNDPALWGKIRLNVSAFLTNVWRSGALFGLTPAEAFYVKCDAETNPPEVRDLGMVVTEIGVAIVRPAEFVIFRITQATGPRPT